MPVHKGDLINECASDVKTHISIGNDFCSLDFLEFVMEERKMILFASMNKKTTSSILNGKDDF